jgi:hypothetical protein
VESIDFLLNLRAGAEETRGRETAQTAPSAQAAQPNNYHSISLAAGAIVAQSRPFSGFLNIFSWIFGGTRWTGEIGPSQQLYPTLETAQCVMQHADVRATREHFSTAHAEGNSFCALQYSKALAAPTFTTA